jgi:hypothetical protein
MCITVPIGLTKHSTREQPRIAADGHAHARPHVESESGALKCDIWFKMSRGSGRGLRCVPDSIRVFSGTAGRISRGVAGADAQETADLAHPAFARRS